MTESSAILNLDDPAWSTFVQSRPEATPFHHPEWASLIADCYGFPGFAFVLRDARGQIVAGLPIVEVGRRRRWVSLAFTDYCGLLGDNSHVDLLLSALDDERRSRGVPSVEIRGPAGPDVHQTTVGYHHVLKLDADADETFARLNRSQVQRGIRKAEREGVRVRTGFSREDVLGSFYSLHLARRRALGVPIQPRAFFEALWERIIAPRLGVVFIAEVNGETAAAAVFLGSQRQLIYKFGASDRSLWSHRPNHALFWEAIKWASENDFTILDFGRTDIENNGLRTFKAGWATTEGKLVHSTLGGARPGRADGIASRGLGVLIRHSPQVVCQYVGEHFYRFAA